MSFFEKLTTNNKAAQIVDLSYRSFENFFTLVEQIGFFEEARRCSIESLILFVMDASVKSRHIYSILQERLRDLPVVRVNNWSKARVTASNLAPYEGMPVNSIEIPRLHFALRAQIDQQTFSFCHLWRTTTTGLRDPLKTELRCWLETVLFQLRNLQSPFASTDVQVSQHDAGAVDQCGNVIVNMLQTNSDRIQAARDQIDELETEIEHLQNRARTWLQLVAKGIGEKR